MAGRIVHCDSVIRSPLAGTPVLALGFSLLWSLGQLSATDNDTQVFERLLQRSNPEAPPAYTAFRRLEGGLTDSDRRGWLEVRTEFRPGAGLTYQVIGEGGSEYVRNKVLRGMLNSEQESLAKGKRLRASLDANNYTFENGGTTSDGLQRIVMKPAKKADGIVNGHLLFNPETGLVSRIEGRLVKSPSFWVRDVDIAYTFAHLNGHILPIDVTSAGRVRLLGRSTFHMSYEYVSVNGQEVKRERTGV